MPLSRPFLKIFINFYIFFLFLKSHSMDLIRNLSLFCCLQKCFLVTPLKSILTAFLVISFLDLNVSISFSYGFFTPFTLLIYKNQFLCSWENIQLISSFFVNEFHLEYVISYIFLECSTGQLIECWSLFSGIFLVWISLLLKSFLFGFFFFDHLLILLVDLFHSLYPSYCFLWGWLLYRSIRF